LHEKIKKKPEGLKKCGQAILVAILLQNTVAMKRLMG